MNDPTRTPRPPRRPLVPLQPGQPVEVLCFPGIWGFLERVDEHTGFVWVAWNGGIDAFSVGDVRARR